MSSPLVLPVTTIGSYPGAHGDGLVLLQALVRPWKPLRAGSKTRPTGRDQRSPGPLRTAAFGGGRSRAKPSNWANGFAL
jgi:hypothetical protein